MAGRPRIHGRRALRIVGRVFLSVTLLMLVLSGGSAIQEHRRGRTGQAEGVVDSFRRGPVVAFTTSDGVVVRFESAYRSSFRHSGDRVAVAYVLDRPSDAEIDGFAGRWFVAALFGGLAGLFVLCGLVLTLLAVRAEARARLASD